MTLEALYALPLAIAGAGAVIDIRKRLLPNVLCLALALASALALGATTDLIELAWALLHALMALLVGMVLFRLGMIGGGDAKFYAAAACGIPFDRGLVLLGWTSLGGLGLLVAVTLMRRASGRKLSEMRGYAVPYGVAIFLGFALTLIPLAGG